MSVNAERSAKQPAKESELLSTTAAPQRHSDDDSAGEAVKRHNMSSASERPQAPPAPTTTPPSISPFQRHHCSGDEDAKPRLPAFVRFHDLRAAGIVSNWPQLYNLIDDYGFPAGMLLSPNCRVWDVQDVRVWLDARPTERKIVNPPRGLRTGGHRGG
jgi:hypothetical protein